MKRSVTILKSIWGRFIMTTFPLFFLVFLSTCITPLDVEPSEFEDLLVVQGFITDDFGPHDIRISRIAKFSGIQEDGVIKIEEAEVRIIDNQGESIPLERISKIRKELQPSITGIPCFTGIFFVNIKTDYRTPENFRGQIGNSYTLEISTKDGKIYHSVPQTIRATPPIDSLIIGFKILPSLDPVVPRSGVEIAVSWQDPPNEENFYFWRINGIYKIFTPDRSNGNFCCAYDPRDGGEETCWILENNIRGNDLAYSDNMTNGQNIILPIGLIEDDGLRFANGDVPGDKQYYIEVEQFMMNEEAFAFSEKIKTLGAINGEIFDPPPFSVNGNIFNIEDSEEKVIGYFGAYSVQKKSLFVPRSMLEFIKRFPDACGDCRIRTGAQIEIPEPYRN